MAERIRVTVTIPVYAARPWVDRIVDNIRRNAAPDREFLLSDQHGLDDAIDVIAQRIDGAARLRCLTTLTREGWIDNYNLVLREARGDYVRILSQDDVLPTESLSHAIAALDADPGMVMVVGPSDLIDEAGAVIWRDTREPASSMRTAGWAVTADAVRLFAGAMNCTMALIRRATLTGADLSIPYTAGESGLSMRALLFGVALRGRVRYEPEYVSQRCVHRHSYTARFWSRSVADEIARARSYWQVGTAAWRAATPAAATRISAPPILAAAVAHMVARRALQRFGARFRAIAAQQQIP